MLLDDYKSVNKKLTSEEVEKELIMQEDYEAIVDYIKENINPYSEDYSIYSEATVYTGKKAIALTPEQLKSRAASLAALSATKVKNRGLYDKYMKVSKLKKKLMAQILKQNLSLAKKTAKKAFKDAQKGASVTLKDKSHGTSGTKGTPNKPKVVKETKKKDKK